MSKNTVALKFAADRTLGKLAKSLRLLGFDTVFFNENDDQAFLSLAKEGRILLTRDSKLVPRISRGLLFIEDNEPDIQLKRLIDFFDLKLDNEQFFTRCYQCNERVSPIEKNAVLGKVPDYIFSIHDGFSVCPACEKIYWKGSHLERFQKRIHSLINIT